MTGFIKPLVPVCAALLIALATGCGTTRSSETVRKVERTPTGDPVVVEEKTTVEKTEANACNGIVSCTFDFAGEVIAFPFRLVGGAFQLIF